MNVIPRMIRDSEGNVCCYVLNKVTRLNENNCALFWCEPLAEEPSDGSRAEAESRGDLPLADTLYGEGFDLVDMPGDRLRPIMRTAFVECPGDSCSQPVAENFALEFGEDRELRGLGTAARSRQVERLAGRDEADLECGHLLKRRDQIEQGTPPTVQPPDQNQVVFPPPRCLDQVFTLGTLADAGVDVLHRHCVSDPVQAWRLAEHANRSPAPKLVALRRRSRCD